MVVDQASNYAKQKSYSKKKKKVHLETLSEFPKMQANWQWQMRGSMNPMFLGNW